MTKNPPQQVRTGPAWGAGPGGKGRVIASMSPSRSNAESPSGMARMKAKISTDPGAAAGWRSRSAPKAAGRPPKMTGAPPIAVASVLVARRAPSLPTTLVPVAGTATMALKPAAAAGPWLAPKACPAQAAEALAVRVALAVHRPNLAPGRLEIPLPHERPGACPRAPQSGETALARLQLIRAATSATQTSAP